jgi:hypothetical protein
MRTVCLICLAALSALAQHESPTLLFQTFDKDASGWTAMGDGAEVRTTRDAARARPGHAALEFTYDIAPKRFAGAVLGAPESIGRMRSLRFWARSDHNTALGVLLAEKKPGGGNYVAWFWAPANAWQAIELTPAEFTAADGPNDPVDPDGKLDVDQVNGIGVFDLAQYFSQFPAGPALPLSVAAQSGRHSLWLDSFEVSAGAPALPTAAAETAPIDPPGRGFLQWIAPGQMDLRVSGADGPLGAGALQASYHPVEGRIELLVRRVPNAQLAAARRLVFDIASEREAALMVVIEMTQPGGGTGPRFTMPVYPPGGREVFHVDLKLADFHGPGQFDPARWRTIAIIETPSADAGPNTLWVANLAAVGKP